MPIHDFRCTACRHEFEQLLRSGSVPACPRCGAGSPERLLSRIAPAATSAGLLRAARRQAAREGHFSHYTAAERAKAAK